jgi:hypothetical protein
MMPDINGLGLARSGTQTILLDAHIIGRENTLPGPAFVILSAAVA